MFGAPAAADYRIGKIRLVLAVFEHIQVRHFRVLFCFYRIRRFCQVFHERLFLPRVHRKLQLFLVLLYKKAPQVFFLGYKLAVLAHLAELFVH